MHLWVVIHIIILIIKSPHDSFFFQLLTSSGHYWSYFFKTLNTLCINNAMHHQPPKVFFANKTLDTSWNKLITSRHWPQVSLRTLFCHIFSSRPANQWKAIHTLLRIDFCFLTVWRILTVWLQFWPELVVANENKQTKNNKTVNGRTSPGTSFHISPARVSALTTNAENNQQGAVQDASQSKEDNIYHHWKGHLASGWLKKEN